MNFHQLGRGAATLPTTGDILEIVDRQTTNPDVALNVYHYRLESGILVIDAADIAEFWWNDCNIVIRELQTSSIDHIRVTCRNIDNSAQYGEYLVPPAEQGGTYGTGDTQARQAAAGIAFRPVTPDVRAGQKRIAGVPEAGSGQWGLWDSVYLGRMTDYADHLSSQLNSLAPAFVLVPVIVGLPNDDRPTRVEVEIAGHVLNPYVTSQNTRKIGRGA